MATMNDDYMVRRVYKGGPWRIFLPGDVEWSEHTFSTMREARDYLNGHDIVAEIAERADRERRRQEEHARYIARHTHPEHEALHWMGILREHLATVYKYAAENLEKFPTHASTFAAVIDDVDALRLRLLNDMRPINAAIEADVDAQRGTAAQATPQD